MWRNGIREKGVRYLFWVVLSQSLGAASWTTLKPIFKIIGTSIFQKDLDIFEMAPDRRYVVFRVHHFRLVP